MNIVDSYAHCGLSKYRPIEHIRDVMASSGVGRTVLVQHLGEFNNAYIAGIVAGSPDQFAGVCLVNHEDPDSVRTLKQLAASGCFKGVRLTTEMCASTPHLTLEAAKLGLNIVLFAPDGISESADVLAEIFDTHPDARVVLTHLGNPDMSQAPKFRAYRQIFQLAAHPGLYFQISGMSMFCPYPHEPLYELINQAVFHFGPQRLCWGSNYPVVGEKEAYREQLHLLLDGGLPIPTDAIPAIAGENAHRLWFDTECQALLRPPSANRCSER